MKNWSTNTKILKQNPAAFRLWKTEQMINFGLDKASLDGVYLKKHFSELNIDPHKKAYLSFLLWPQKQYPKK